ELSALANLPNNNLRSANYSSLQRIHDDLIAGNASFLGLILAGEQSMIEDKRRGLFSEESLRQRLEPPEQITASVSDLQTPLIQLRPLSRIQHAELLRKLVAIHARYHRTRPLVGDSEIQSVLELHWGVYGAADFIPTREVVRS